MTLYPCPKPPKSPKRPRKPLCRSGRIKPRGKRFRKSGGHLFYKHVDEARRDFIRSQRCVVTGAASGEWIQRQAWMPKTLPRMWRCYVVAAHCKGRGASGPDKANMLPLDYRMHDWQGQIGWPAFEKRLELESRFEIAALYETRYQLEAA